MFPIEIIGNIGKYCNYQTYKSLVSTSKLYYKNLYNHKLRCHYILDSITVNSRLNDDQLCNLFTTACYYNDTYMLKLIVEKGSFLSIIKLYEGDHRIRDICDFKYLLYTDEIFIRFLIKYLFDNKRTKFISDYIILIICDLNYTQLLKDTIKQLLEYSEIYLTHIIHNEIMKKACQFGNLKILKFLMKLNLINPFKLFYNGTSGYQIACKYGKDNVVKYLIKDQISKNIPIHKRFLITTFNYKRPELITFLLQYYDLINFVGEHDFMSCLLSTHNMEIINMFINRYPESKYYMGRENYINDLLKSKEANYESVNFIIDNFPYLLKNIEINKYTFIPVIKDYCSNGRLDLLKLVVNKFKISLDINIILSITKNKAIIAYALSLSDC